MAISSSTKSLEEKDSVCNQELADCLLFRSLPFPE